MGSGTVRLSLEGVASPAGEEAYHLRVAADEVRLSALTATGLFRGAQTLRQLFVTSGEGPSYLASCEIEDRPAFAVRGMMHDTGRNYMGRMRPSCTGYVPLHLLKEQIRMMARYKMNLFHWHLTEDIAWRLEIKKYPAFTRPEAMLRDKGQYYTQEEARELVAFARARHVTVLPEIDMPGHSAAFERALGVPMQSEKGKRILKDVLREVCALFEGPYVHLGTDEVEVTDPDFLPEMVRTVREAGKEVVAWKPGGAVDDRVVRQLWTGRPTPATGTQSIDSRHLYLNHNDPLAGVVKTFNRKICDADQGTEDRLGGILCIWNDRRPAREEDVVLMNGVYPQMLAFAERTWRGGGRPELGVRIGAPYTEAHRTFAEFEDRLIAHGMRHFAGKPFPYVRQAHVPWTLIGPFDNGGDLTAVFPPEQTATRTGAQGFGRQHLQPGAATLKAKKVVGATIWLRHCFFPMLAGNVEDPVPNSTIYAVTYVRSEREREAHMWIGFHNPSRSESDDTPPLGQWDYKQSKVWLNGAPVAPPCWSKPGRKGHMEAPYIDESYEQRAPAPVTLRAGWNQILVKAPVGAFTSEHTRLVKWMFTAALLEWNGERLRALEDVEYSTDPDVSTWEEAASE